MSLLGSPRRRRDLDGAGGKFAGRKATQEFTIQPSYASGSYVPLHFGLGQTTRLDSLTVVWPEGTVQELPPPAVDRRYRVSRKDGVLEGLRGLK